MSQFIYLISILFSQVAFSGEFEFWNSTSVEQKLNEKYSTYGEFIYRHSREEQDLKVLSTRLGLIREFDNKWKGALIAETRSTDNKNNNEFRSIFQVSKKFDLENVKLTVRARWELRKFSDSTVTMNRFRFFSRADLVTLNFYELTPFLALEKFLITNTVASRPAGSSEFRGQIGLSTNGLGGIIDLAYLFREQKSPTQGSNPSKYSMYHIFNTSLKYTF